MRATPRPGTDSPATLQGAGWRPRARPHADELGTVWGRVGVRREWDRLRRVVLTSVVPELSRDGSPNDWLMAEFPDLHRLSEERSTIAAFYVASGVDVVELDPRPTAPPNVLFARDLFFATPEGVVLARMAAEQRAGEERLAARALATAGVPILATPTGSATFEGADALWAAPDLVLIGVGRRTNEAGYGLVRAVLAAQGVDVVAVPLPDHVQHLLGALNFVDADLAVTLGLDTVTARMLHLRGVRTLDFVRDDETTRCRALNFVTLGPREVVMPAGAPRTRARLEAEGVRVHTLAVDAYLGAEGGLGCLTGILERG